MKSIMILAMALGLAVSAVASDSNTLFNARELSVSLGSTYAVDRSTAFKQAYSFNLEAGAQYFITRNVGLSVNVPFYQSKGVSLSEVQAGVVARLPLFRHVAPYIGASAVYNWHAENEWAYIAKAGVEYRFNAGWGLFAEGQFRNTDFNLDKGVTSVGAGLRLVF